MGREANETACQGPRVELLSSRGSWLALAVLSVDSMLITRAVMVTGRGPLLAALPEAGGLSWLISPRWARPPPPPSPQQRPPDTLICPAPSLTHRCQSPVRLGEAVSDLGPARWAVTGL